MRSSVAILIIATTVVACKPKDAPSSDEMLTVEYLASNAERLAQLRQQCKTDRAALGEVLCNRVAEATRQRFFGDGTAPYTPPKDPPKF